MTETDDWQYSGSLKRFLVVGQAEPRTDPRKMIHKVFAFLGVDPEFYSSHFDEEFLKTSERRRYTSWFAHFVELRITPTLRRLPPKHTLLPDACCASEVDRLPELTGIESSSWGV